MTLVTGSSGQLGSYVVEELRRWNPGEGTRGVDLVPSRWTTTRGDVRDPEIAGRSVTDGDVIIHCAAQVSVSHSVESPWEDASHNIDGTLKMLETARQRDAQRFVYISSAAAYGDPIEIPITENHPTDPQSPYGLSKLTGERYALMYHELYGLPVTALRPFNIYSPRQDPDNPYSGVISKFAERIRKGKAPIIFGDGEQTRDFIHAMDVVRAVKTVIETDETNGHVYNVGTGEETTINELATLMLEAAEQGDQTPTYEDPQPGDIRRSVADISPLQDHGYEPKIPLAEGLAALI